MLFYVITSIETLFRTEIYHFLATNLQSILKTCFYITTYCYREVFLICGGSASSKKIDVQPIRMNDLRLSHPYGNVQKMGRTLLVGDGATTRFRLGTLYKFPTKNGHLFAPSFVTQFLDIPIYSKIHMYKHVFVQELFQ